MKLGKGTLKKLNMSFLTGAVNGLFGGGGGMVAVPLLKNMLGYNERCAHATAILVIAPICAAGSVVYIAKGYLDPTIVIPAAIGSVVGGIFGAMLLTKLPEKVVAAVFVAVMLAAGLRMLF